MVVNKDFAGWYYNREEFIRIYGEPSDSLIREFKHEVDCMVMQIADYNKPSVRMTEKDRDHAMVLFNDFWNDHVDEDEINHSDVIEFYHATVDGFSEMDTCTVLGMINGCLQNDDYEEADLVARLYINKAEHQRHLEWKAFDAERTAGCKDLYQPESHAHAVVNLMNLIILNLKGDTPAIGFCVTLCDSMYAEILEKEKGGFNVLNGKEIK